MKRDTAAGPPASLSFRFGRQLELRATGWGVAAAPLLLLILFGAGLAGLFLGWG